MTKEDWAIAEKRALQGYKGCRLLIDGYNITLQLEPMTTYKKSIAIYVNGEIDFKRCMDNCEERQRFFWARKRTIVKSKEMQKVFKQMSKRRQAAWQERNTYTWYWPYWDSFASLKRHLIANNTSIELVSDEEDNEHE